VGRNEAARDGINTGDILKGFLREPAAHNAPVMNEPTGRANLKHFSFWIHNYELCRTLLADIVLVIALATMRLEIPDEFSSAKQDCFTLGFGQAFIVRGKFAHSLKCAYQLLHKERYSTISMKHATGITCGEQTRLIPRMLPLNEKGTC
jgi:hypothetical protein